MNRNITIALLILFTFLSCSKKPKQAVNWHPIEIQTGKQLLIQYHVKSHDAVLSESSEIVLVGNFYFKDSDSIFVERMSKYKDVWQIRITPPIQTILLSFKFEDELNRTDDNNGKGWMVDIINNDGKVAINNHYYKGLILSGNSRPEALIDYKQAISEFSQEIQLFPENYSAVFEKWQLELKMKAINTQYINKHLDSLINNDGDNEELIKLAFYTNGKILQEYQKAINFGEEILRNYSHTNNIDEIAYSMIFLKHPHNVKSQIKKIEKFILDYPKSKLLKTAYFRLANYYLNQMQDEKAKTMFYKIADLYPHDISNILTLASMEINQKNFEKAANLLENAKSVCTDEVMRKLHPWTHPGKRKNQINFNLCQIYSSTASLNFLQNKFDEAIKNRKKVIEIGTPFPAFEWLGIGDAYLEKNEINNAKDALIKALSINPNQNETINKLKLIYIEETGSDEGFEDYKNSAVEEELKASAQLAPDFEITDLNDKKYKLSEMRGRVVILCFWDSWSSECMREIPILNELKKTYMTNDMVKFWAISLDHKLVINNFLKKNKFDYHHFYNGKDVNKLYKVISFPTHIIIDKNGFLRYKYSGYVPDLKLRMKQKIKLLLKEGEVVS